MKTTKCMLNFKTSTEKQNKSEEKKLQCMLKLKSNSHSLKKKQSSQKVLPVICEKLKKKHKSLNKNKHRIWRHMER